MFWSQDLVTAITSRATSLEPTRVMSRVQVDGRLGVAKMSSVA